jgi:hypothetical protein
MFDYLHTPCHLDLLFAATVLATLFMFFIAARRSKAVLLVSLVWLLLQSVMSMTGFYADTLAMPPGFPLLVLPPLLLTVYLFASKNGRPFIDGLNLRMLTDLHVVRALVEVVLWRLHLQTYVPELMTFEGRNFDILAGVSAPIVAFFAFRRPVVKRSLLIVWNVVALCLVLNIVVHAILSAPSPIQRLAFEQPNIAVLYFPYALLPGFIVPVVLFAHVASLRILLRKRKAPLEAGPV